MCKVCAGNPQRDLKRDGAAKLGDSDAVLRYHNKVFQVGHYAYGNVPALKHFADFEIGLSIGASWWTPCSTCKRLHTDVLSTTAVAAELGAVRGRTEMPSAEQASVPSEAPSVEPALVPGEAPSVEQALVPTQMLEDSQDCPRSVKTARSSGGLKPSEANKLTQNCELR